MKLVIVYILYEKTIGIRGEEKSYINILSFINDVVIRICMIRVV